MTPLEAAARAMYALDWDDDPTLPENAKLWAGYLREARAALTAAANSLTQDDFAAIANAHLHRPRCVIPSRDVLLRALLGETSVSGNQ